MGSGSPTLGVAAADWASAKRVVVGAHSIRYREAGSGAPIVLVHGLGVSADYWVRNGPPLAAAGYRVLAPDLPGFGRTEGPLEAMGILAQAESLRRWAEKIKLASAVYVGHSLSCQTVLELAARHPACVRALILAAPTGEGGSLRRLARQAFALLRDLPRESLRIAAVVAAAYVRAGPRRVLRTWHLGARHDPMRTLPEVRVPTLIVLGERDPVVDRSFAARMAEGLADAMIVEVADGSHGVHFDTAEGFNDAAIDFMKRIDRRAEQSAAEPHEMSPEAMD
jgi:2-hydroxy-6-oxonona-2,4-dienedioate hydrolase